MRQFGQRHFAGLALPAIGDVRLGTTYGPNSSLIGTLVVTAGGTAAPDLSDGNLSQIEDTEIYALESYYQVSGIDAEYYSKADDQSKWIKVYVVRSSESLDYDGGIQYQHETLVLMLKRFGTNAIERPAKGDRITVTRPESVRKYSLTETPVVASGQLEWKAEFSRSKQIKGGGKEVVAQV